MDRDMDKDMVKARTVAGSEVRSLLRKIIFNIAKPKLNPGLTCPTPALSHLNSDSDSPNDLNEANASLSWLRIPRKNL